MEHDNKVSFIDIGNGFSVVKFASAHRVNTDFLYGSDKKELEYEIKRRLANELGNYMIENGLAVFTKREDYTTGGRVYTAYTCVLCKENIKLLHGVKT